MRAGAHTTCVVVATGLGRSLICILYLWAGLCILCDAIYSNHIDDWYVWWIRIFLYKPYIEKWNVRKFFMEQTYTYTECIGIKIYYTISHFLRFQVIFYFGGLRYWKVIRFIYANIAKDYVNRSKGKRPTLEYYSLCMY